jgi:thioredoxin reductase
MASARADPPTFEGETIDVRPGETLVEALARHGRWPTGRSLRFHRPRAPFCGVGACSQCLVRVNGQPNVRACRYLPAAGDRVSLENAWPTARFDLFGALDLLFYRGIDTHHGFRRPRFATPLYHRVVRRLAGFGRLADPPRVERAPPARTLDADVLIVGGGPSGRAVADRLAGSGPTVVVLDRALGRTGAGAPDALAGYTVAFLPPPAGDGARPFTAVATREDGRGLRVRAARVVVAVGGYDAGLVFDGNDRPGVMSGDGALAIGTGSGASLVRQAVVFGGDDRAGEMLDRLGPRVAAVVAPGAIAPAVADRAARLGVPLYPRTLLLATRGRRRVRAVRLRPRGGGAAFDLRADAVVLAHRRLPSTQLLFQAGARMEWRAGPGAFFPVLGPGGTTSVPGLLAVGEAAGFLGADGARASGEAAGEFLLGRSPPPSGPRVDGERPGEMYGYLAEVRPLLAGARRVMLCPCEDILLGELEEAHAAGHRGLEVVKRFTGVGTGLCQGRYCLPDALLLLSIAEARSPPEVGYITQRPPVFPAPLDALAALEPPPPGSPG